MRLDHIHSVFEQAQLCVHLIEFGVYLQLVGVESASQRPHSLVKSHQKLHYLRLVRARAVAAKLWCWLLGKSWLVESLFWLLQGRYQVNLGLRHSNEW